ncbi:MAG: fibrobacter succinogenes major paralogous domain-containing protein [Bacteroidia bacterium]
MKHLIRSLSIIAVVALMLNGCKKKDDASCIDGIKNGTETAVDCGGPDCNPCSSSESCSDGIQNGNETGVDCGGSCAPCTVAPSCTDGIQNGNETGVDCGGSCPPCSVVPTCNDGIQNGDETGVDCGGSCPNSCATCTDGIQNGDETGIDCGGSCPACFSCGNSITDVEGNVYATTEIGGRCWTTSNMKTSTYNDGTAISGSGWSNYGNDPANDNTYGKLYSNSVASSAKLCPEGWHVPTDAEWTQMINSIGGTAVAGGKLKSTSNLWLFPNTGASNSTGFTALPGGYYSGSFGHFDISYYAYFWSTTQGSQSNQAWSIGLSNADAVASRLSSAKVWHMSCRCVED